MNVLRFQARDSAQAIRQIRSQLGAEAVVLSVTPLPVKGLSRLWRRPGLEVLAGLPEQQEEGELRNPKPEIRNKSQAENPRAGDEAGMEGGCSGRGRGEDALILSGERGARRSLLTSPPTEGEGPAARPYAPPVTPHSSAVTSSSWRSASVLGQMGLQPRCIERVLERARGAGTGLPPSSFAEEFALVRTALNSFWQSPAAAQTQSSPPIHVFVGPPGSGKTTVLCKWLAKSVLVENRTARAWRLDSRSANFAGLLDFYSEILGVPLERDWREPAPLPGFELGFVDLPGANPHDPLALQQVRTRLASISGAQVHLVLNAAYETAVLLAQVRAFGALPLSGLILTHLDEEKRRGKLWNLVLGTNLPVRFLSGGQNIPGEFSPATPEQLYGR